MARGKVEESHDEGKRVVNDGMDRSWSRVETNVSLSIDTLLRLPTTCTGNVIAVSARSIVESLQPNSNSAFVE